MGGMIHLEKSPSDRLFLNSGDMINLPLIHCLLPPNQKHSSPDTIVIY